MNLTQVLISLWVESKKDNPKIIMTYNSIGLNLKNPQIKNMLLKSLKK